MTLESLLEVATPDYCLLRLDRSPNETGLFLTVGDYQQPENFCVWIPPDNYKDFQGFISSDGVLNGFMVFPTEKMTPCKIEMLLCHKYYDFNITWNKSDKFCKDRIENHFCMLSQDLYEQLSIRLLREIGKM